MENENTNVNTENPGEGVAQQASTQATAQQTVTQAQQNQQQEQPAGRVYTQEQLDAIIDRAQKRATKGLFTPEQMAAKDTAISTLTTERDTERAEKAKLQEQLDALKHEKFLAGKGVPADALEFYAFKIGKLVTDKKSFEEAATEYLKDNPPAGTVRMSTGGGVGGNGGNQPPNSSEVMNALIRGATK